jgi:hypothetical protein
MIKIFKSSNSVSDIITDTINNDDVKLHKKELKEISEKVVSIENY